MEARLAGAGVVEGEDRPTIADIALYAYTHSAETKGGFDLSPYPGIRAWLGRVVALSGHVPLDHIPGA